MKASEIKPFVFHVTFSTQEELAKAFLPFQEYYENIHFAGKQFTFEEFKEWYVEKFGNFSYYEDWSGFNVPGHIFNEFPWSEKLTSLVMSIPEAKALHRKVVLELMQQAKTESIYIIGTTEETDPSTLEHELAHARYALDGIYRHSINKILLNKQADFADLEKHLQSISYHPKVILDEVHAYILTEEEYLTEKGLWNYNLKTLREEMNRSIWK